MSNYPFIAGALTSLVKANIYALIIVSIVYILERVFKLKIFYGYFRWKKSQKNARIAADGDTGYYFIFCGLIYAYDIWKGHIQYHWLSTVIWVVCLIFLSIVFHDLYSNYQGVDPNKKDSDFT